MASTRNEPLLENEEDEEKMKNELLKAGFNEPMDKSEMIRIYQILQESKETSLLNVPPDWDDSVDRNPVVENSPDSDASTKDVLDRVSKLEQRIKAEEETRKQKEIEETMKRDERICKRLQEQEEENLRRIERERIRSEKEKSYIVKLKTKKITRANFDNPQPTHEDITEDLLLSGTDDELTTTYSNLRNSCCPICQKSFPFDEIESHASECDAFLSESDEMVDQQPCSSRLLYECDICNKFNTYDGNYYEEHVVECMKADKDKHGIYV